jgi:hypothetical protein
VPQAGSRNGERVGLHSGRVGCPRSSLVSSAEFPLVPSHSEGGSRTASRILITTQKRIEFDPTHRKQTTEVASNRNKKPLFPLLALRWTRGVLPNATKAGKLVQPPASSSGFRSPVDSTGVLTPDFQLPEPSSQHAATRNDSRKLATATKHDANNFLAATKSHVLRCLHSGAASLSESRWNSPRVPETGIGEDSVTGAKAAAKDLPRRGVFGPSPGDWRTRNTLLQCL